MPEDGQEHEWMALARACATNGDGLAADASLLLEHHRAPRALSLAVLAMEEYAKAVCAAGVIAAGGADEVVKMYKDVSVMHRLKLKTGHVFARLFDPSTEYTPGFSDRLDAIVATASERKLAGLYVDRTRSGLSLPDEISESDASEALQIVSALGDYLRFLHDPELTGELVSQAWQEAPPFVDAVAAQIVEESASLGEAMAAVRSLQDAFPVVAPDAVPHSSPLDESL